MIGQLTMDVSIIFFSRNQFSCCKNGVNSNCIMLICYRYFSPLDCLLCGKVPVYIIDLFELITSNLCLFSSLGTRFQPTPKNTDATAEAGIVGSIKTCTSH